MTTLLAILAACLAIIAWNLCAMIRDAVARERWRKLAEQSFDEITHDPRLVDAFKVKNPHHVHGDTL